MTPESAIAMLDRQIADHGQSVSFRRTGVVHQTSGFVRGYRAEELVGTITQADRRVIVSPTNLNGFEPKRDDEFATLGRVGRVMEVEPVNIGSTVVRYNINVRMA